jgi:hypothetical protein
VLGFQCVPGQGSDAYVVDLPPLASDGFVQSFVIVLVGGGRGDGDTEAGALLLPPSLHGLDAAEFAWRLSTGDAVAVVTGDINAIQVVAEPSPLLLFAIAMGAAAARHQRRGRLHAAHRCRLLRLSAWIRSALQCA